MKKNIFLYRKKKFGAIYEMAKRKRPDLHRMRTLPHVWCPYGKTPFDFSPELRGLFFKHLNQETMNEILEMQSRCSNIPDMGQTRDELDECILYVQCLVMAKRMKC